jgi:L-fuconolactonase
MLDVDQPWLDQVATETPIGVGFPIVDPHHHLWDVPPMSTYGLAELRSDTDSGWPVEATVFVECMSHYRAEGDGPKHLRFVGETDYVVEAARAGAGSSGARISGIVSRADMMLGAAVEEVLRAHIDAGDGLFRGIRHATSWDEDASIRSNHTKAGPGAMASPEFVEGVRCLGRLGLSFDAWLFHPQISELTDLARKSPDTTIVLDHLGGPLAVGRHRGHEAEADALWRANLAELATCPNVVVKLGGIGMADFGGDWRMKPMPPSSETLAALWNDRFAFIIGMFGAARGMFESNFPVDKASCSYVTLWNTFARMASGASTSELRQLFRGTANRVYRLGLAD